MRDWQLTIKQRIATVYFANPLAVRASLDNAKSPVRKHVIDMTLWTMNWDFSKFFELPYFDDGTPLAWYRGETALDRFLEFQGRTFEEARTRFRILGNWFEEGRFEIYLPLQIFYEELALGNVPERIELEEELDMY